MRIRDVSIENFACVGSVSYSLENGGLIIVNGDNRDTASANSNGSGKSTIVVDALSWCFYGVTTKSNAADSVLPEGKGKGTRVCTNLTLDDGRNVTIARHRKHPTHANAVLLSIDGKDCTKATNPQTDAEIERVLRVDKQTFWYTTILGQGLMFRFSQLTDAGQKELLERVLESEVYESARKTARGVATEAAAKVSQIDATYADYDNRVTRERSRLASYLELQKEAAAKEKVRRDGIAVDLANTTASLAIAERKLKELPAFDYSYLEKLDEGERLAFNIWQRLVNEASDTAAVKNGVEYALSKLNSTNTDVPCPNCGQPIDKNHVAREKADYSKRLVDVTKAHTDKKSRSDIAYERHKNLQIQMTTARAQSFAAKTVRDALQSNVDSLTTRRDELQRELARPASPLFDDKVVKQHEAAVAEAEAALQKHAATRKELALQSDYANWWVTAFQTIRVKVIDRALVYLNSRIKHYCDVLTDGEIVAVVAHNDKGKIELRVSTRGGTYQSASGGEKDRVDIAITLALHDLVSERTSFRSNILVFDEVGGFLDVSGIERLMKLISEKLDRVETAIVISHNPNFANYGDRTWTVVREGGVSRLETV